MTCFIYLFYIGHFVKNCKNNLEICIVVKKRERVKRISRWKNVWSMLEFLLDWFWPLGLMFDTPAVDEIKAKNANINQILNEKKQ